MSTVAALQSRTNTTSEDWEQVEVTTDPVAAGLLQETSTYLNRALGWTKYRAVTVEVPQMPEPEPEFPIEPTHTRRRAFPTTGYRKQVAENRWVTASPTWLCVWGRHVGHDLIAGPFKCPDEVREPNDLDGWYQGWVEAGEPT